MPERADAACPDVGAACASLARALSAGGGCLVVPSTSALMRNAAFTDALALGAPLDADSPAPAPATLAFGETVRGRGAAAGVHLMDMPFVRDATETVTGLAAAGCHVVLVLSTPPAAGAARAPAGHPIVPVLHVGLARAAGVGAAYAASTDAVVVAAPAPAPAAALWADGALAALARLAAGEIHPKASEQVFFNITRGPTGVST